MGETDPVAEEIAEDLLYRTGQALTTGDYKWLEGCFALPQMIETLEGSRLAETYEDICEIIDQVRRYYSDNDVSDLVRTVIEAKFLEPGVIGSTHVSRLIKSDGTLFRAPFPTYSVLMNLNGMWTIATSAYAILDAPEHNSALHGWTVKQTQ